ncbi:MAG: hypothetical protein HC866_21215 [Leptolyngbyaceae cyanobacterium RU_5_1]|nr:hypothetical protein [Leptolyngbyaceae cyanobacterium RU_5_1]
MVSSVSPSPSSVSAPAPAEVAAAAALAGAAWLVVRPSERSFSGWVGVALFAPGGAAFAFAGSASAAWSLPSLAVRRRGRWVCVSVPVFVSEFPEFPVESLPCGWFPLSVGGSGGSPAPSPAPVPGPVAAALGSAPALGFSGSRSAVPPVLGPVLGLASVAAVPVLVGCAKGVDQAVRSAFESSPRLVVFAASSFGRGRGSFATRSVELVRSLFASQGVLFSFPSSPCPLGLLPSSSASGAFSGSGSGSWASLALAVGLGVRCFVFAPFGVPSGWGFVSVGSGWWSFVPVGFQLPLV